jgi:hypothetical protein
MLDPETGAQQPLIEIDNAFYLEQANRSSLTGRSLTPFLRRVVSRNGHLLQVLSFQKGKTSGLQANENPDWVCISSDVEELSTFAFKGACLISVAFESHSQLTDIGYSAFKACSAIRHICIPASVKTLGDYCFADCANLLNVTFARVCSVTRIPSFAFLNCAALPLITIPSSVGSLEPSCFAACGRLVLVLFESKSNLTYLGAFAFRNCGSLESLWVPASVREVARHCFTSCHKLSSLVFERGSQLARFESDEMEDVPLHFWGVPPQCIQRAAWGLRVVTHNL